MIELRFSKYFYFMRNRTDRKDIKMAWIRHVYENPVKEEIQLDGRIRRWAKIDEVNKYLRIVILEDKVTIHNAFFDRNYKEV
jgi:hypothetical protein